MEFGKTLFESAEYAARNRNDHWYVYDLYKTFLLREPDASGWAYWESVVPQGGFVRGELADKDHVSATASGQILKGNKPGKATKPIRMASALCASPSHSVLAKIACGLDSGRAAKYMMAVINPMLLR